MAHGQAVPVAVAETYGFGQQTYHRTGYPNALGDLLW